MTACGVNATGSVASLSVLWSNRHRSFDSARENKAVRPQDHLKRAATANLLVSYENCGVWWRLLHNSGVVRLSGPPARDRRAARLWHQCRLDESGGDGLIHGHGPHAE